MPQQETELVLGNAKCTLVMNNGSAVPMASRAHVHPNYELFYVWRGGVDIITDEKIYHVKAGQAALIAPTCYHQTYTYPDTEKFNVCFSFALMPKRSKAEDVYMALGQAFSGLSIMVVDSAREIGGIISGLRQLQLRNCFCREERLKAELTKLMMAIYDFMTAQMQQQQMLSGNQAGNVLYQYEIDRLLAKNYEKDISLAFLAEQLHLSQKRVSVLIKSLYGKTFRKVIAEMRIQTAKQFLKESGHTVAEIGALVGYKSTRGFLSAFTDLVGLTPSQYREEKLGAGKQNHSVK